MTEKDLTNLNYINLLFSKLLDLLGLEFFRRIVNGLGKEGKESDLNILTLLV